MKHLILKIKRNCGGYTIIETMIAISLFLVVIMAGMTALLNASSLHQKSQDMRSILDNLSFVMEEMSRNLRTGYNYHCYVYGTGLGVDNIFPSPLSALAVPKSCPNGQGVSFEPADGNKNDYNDQVIYYYYGGSLWKMVGPYDSFSMSQVTQLTPPEIQINPISGFSVSGASPYPADNQQPLVSIRLVGQINYKNVITPFSIQTAVSQRLSDISQ